MTIRSFCNADLPELVRLWNEHSASLGRHAQVTMAVLEQAVLARPFFDPRWLLVAESRPPANGKLAAWCYALANPDDRAAATVAALCIDSQAPIAIGSDLLAEMERQLAAAAIQRVDVGVVRDDRYGMSGLDPIGHGAGIPAADLRLTSILSDQGYQPDRRTQRLIVPVSGYRPPVSRDAMQLRRSSEPTFYRYVPDDRRTAAALSHLDTETHRLSDRNGTQLARVNLWLSDAEAQVMSPARAILDLTPVESPDKLTTAESYLIATMIQSLTPRGIAVVETVVDDRQQVLNSQLQSLRLTVDEEGIRWQKQLSS